MEQRGTKSGERQRMRNLLLSRDRLARTLAANFTGGDLLVTLTYPVGPRPRPRELARQQVRQWIGSISGLRRAQGMDAKYVYLLGTEQAGSLVHRVILNRGRESASILGHPWPYGPVYVGPLDLSQQGQALASELLRQFAREHANAWLPRAARLLAAGDDDLYARTAALAADAVGSIAE